jgi:hypothetical protein
MLIIRAYSNRKHNMRKGKGKKTVSSLYAYNLIWARGIGASDRLLSGNSFVSEVAGVNRER